MVKSVKPNRPSLCYPEPLVENGPDNDPCAGAGGSWYGNFHLMESYCNCFGNANGFAKVDLPVIQMSVGYGQTGCKIADVNNTTIATPKNHYCACCNLPNIGGSCVNGILNLSAIDSYGVQLTDTVSCTGAVGTHSMSLTCKDAQTGGSLLLTFGR